MRPFISMGFILFLIMVTSGCGATIAYECLVGPECDSDPSVRYYHGVKTDFELWKTPPDAKISEFGTWFHRGIIIGDTPISFAVDTALLPFHFLKNVIQGNGSTSLDPQRREG